MSRPTAYAHAALVHALARRPRSCLRGMSDAGQATAEYALVLLGAAAVALLVLAWATKTNQISKLFDVVLKEIVGRVR